MKRRWLSLVVALLGVAPSLAAELPRTLDLTLIRALPLQHDGRWPPLDTVARDVVESVTGDTFYQGHDPVLLLLAWTFDASCWQETPLIDISNAELRRELELPTTQTVFSYGELLRHRRLHDLIDELSRIEEGRKPDPLESKVGDINEKLFKLQQVFSGRFIRVIPDSQDALGAWRPVTPTAAEDPTQANPIRDAWMSLGIAFVADDTAAFATRSQKLIEVQRAAPAAHRPEPQLIATELRYNRLRPFHVAWIVMTGGAVLATIALLLRAVRKDTRSVWRSPTDLLAVLALMAGFGILSYGLSLRWQIAGRIPASNMFESLLFLSWGMGAFAILSMFLFRDRIVPLTASAMGALALVLADVLPLDHFVRPIAPVLLDTFWMSVHVPIIMVSYSVLALAVLIAHVQLLVMALASRRQSLGATLDTLHYWYVHVGSILLIAGIITGSMWAASSWGRYWGWDPKEVWSLVAFLGYMAILHVRIDRERVAPWMYGVAAILAIAVLTLVVPKLAPLTPGKIGALAAMVVAMFVFLLARGPFATAFKSILAFWMIIMTYVGVNFVLGSGLHSYGFGTGAVVKYMSWIGGIDLALIGLCCVIYLARNGWKAFAATPQSEATTA